MAEDHSGSCSTYSCRFICGELPNCVPELCKTLTSVFVITFGLLAIPITIRLVQFHRHSPIPRWSLKKLLYISILIICVFRFIGYTLQLTLSDSDTVTLSIFLFFYWYGLHFVFVAYFLLLSFWWHICRKKMPSSWLGKRMKVILIISNILLGLIFAALIGLHFVQSLSVLLIPFNALISILMLTLCGAYLREGVKFYRLLKTFTQVKPLVKDLTRILIGSSSVLIMTILVLIFATLIRSAFFPDSNVACQISHLIYRCLEIGVVVLLGYPLRTYKTEQDTSGSYPSNGKPSVHLKSLESGEKSETKSDQSEELKSDTE